MLPEVPVLLLLRSEPEEPVLLPPGVKAPPVAELAPERPKYENTLWRQLGWLRSVLASKFGADCNLLVSPEKTNVGCCELELELVPRADEVLPDEEERKSIQGTATCLPLAVVLDELEELMPVLLLPEFPLKEITAHSNLPECGLTMKSLIVPISLPDELVTCAPVSWLPRKASCAIRPVALKCLPLQPD